MLPARAIQATPSGACAAPTPDIEPSRKGRDWSITAAIRVRRRRIAPPGDADATQHRPAAVRAPFTNRPRALMLAGTNLPRRPGKDTALGAPR